MESIELFPVIFPIIERTRIELAHIFPFALMQVTTGLERTLRKSKHQ